MLVHVSKAGLSFKSESGSLAEGTTGQGWGVQPQPDSKSSALEQACSLSSTRGFSCRGWVQVHIPASSSTCPRAISEVSPRNSMA